MHKIVVTGANGFLGSWLTRTLTSQGLRPSVLVRKNSDLSEIESLSPEVLHGDVTDLDSLKSAFAGCDTVFHLAGLVAYRASERKKMELVNVQGTANVIAACREHKVRRLVYLSSVVAVGASFSPGHILDESSPYQVGSLNLGYFETKRAAEQLVVAAAKRGELEAVILNPSTIYGPGDAKKGSRSTQLKVARGRFPFYPSGGVSVVDVGDVVDAILAAWRLGRSGERYILSGENLTIQQLFQIISECAGVRAPRFHLPTQILLALGYLGDAAGLLGIRSSLSKETAYTATLYHWFKHEKAFRQLGFRPRPARESIQKSVEWMRSNGYLDVESSR